MRAFEFLLEKAPPAAVTPADQQSEVVPGDPNKDPLYNLKLAVANKIKVLPADKSTEKALGEIEEILSSTNAGGRVGFIGGQLQSINDPEVNAAQKILAKYVLSLDAPQQQKNELFSAWKSDKLVNIDLLLSPGKHSIADIIVGYGKNAAITELTDDLSQVAALGQGKGEFLLSVFSKRINKRKKGDLQIAGKNIEVKTLDVGGGRFYDQEVRPSNQFSNAVENFRNTWDADIKAVMPKIPGTGLKLVDVMNIGQKIEPKRAVKYFKDFENVLSTIFPGMDISKIMAAVKTNNIGAAKQSYAVTNLNYYSSVKVDDDAMMFIDLASKPFTFVVFTNAEELAKGGLRLHADTVYPITNDPRNAYPQMRILASKQLAP